MPFSPRSAGARSPQRWLLPFTVNLTAGLIVFLISLLIQPDCIVVAVKVWARSPPADMSFSNPASIQTAPNPLRLDSLVLR